MGSLTLTSRQKHRRLPQVDIPVISDNDEMRRFSESIKEHLRMYEGDSGAPKERFVTLEELEHTGLVTTKVQSGFASIDKILGEQIAAVPSAIPVTGSPGFGGGGGVRTFRALDDTEVDGIEGGQGVVWNGAAFVPLEFPTLDLDDAVRYDMMYFDGAAWRPTDEDLQWNPDDSILQLANAHSINWLDTATVPVTKDLLNFREIGSGTLGSEVGHVIAKSFASQTTTSGTYVDKTGGVIAHASLDDNEDYLVIARCMAYNATSQATAANGVRLTYNNAVVSGGEKLWEGVIGITNQRSMPYSWCGIISSGTTGDLQIEFKSGNGSDTIDCSFVTLLAIKVSDLVFNSNIWYDADTATIELDDGNFPPTNYQTLGASITIGDGVSDYLVFASVSVGDFTTGGNTTDWRIRESVVNTTKVGGVYQRADNSDEIPQAHVFLYRALADASLMTIEATCTGFPVDAKRSFIAAIRLNAFAEFFTGYDADPDETDWSFPESHDVATISATATVTSTKWGFIAAVNDSWTGASPGQPTTLVLDIAGAGDVIVGGDATWEVITNGTSRRETRFMVSADQSITADDTIDADCQIDTNSNATGDAFKEALIVAFTWELRVEEGFDVGHAGYVTRMKGKTTRFYDPGLIDYVEFDHDDTDFNITGFQTTDINITGITDIDLVAGLRIFDSNKDDDVRFSHDGTNFLVTGTQTANIIVSGHTGFMELSTADGGEMLRLTDSGGDGVAALMWIGFWDQDSRQGVIGFGSGSDERLRFRTDAATAGLYFFPGDSIVDFDAVLRMKERSAALADVASYGQWWVKTASPTEPWFTTDTGVDSRIPRNAIGETITASWHFTSSGESSPAIKLTSANPVLEWNETDGSADNKNWYIEASSETFLFRVANDVKGAFTTYMTVARTGTTVDSVDIATALTANSFGGITSANLVDKTDVETISGVWTFTADDGLIIANASPEIHLRETDATVDEGNWIIRATGDGLKFQTASDAAPTTGAESPLTFLRTGTVADEVRVKAALLSIRGGAAFDVLGSGNVNKVRFSHDNTDFNIAGTTTTDINITGITAIAAGTVDADFDAITATSYEGIAAANILSRIAAEAISGVWSFTGAPAVIINHNNPNLRWVDANAALDEKIWEQIGIGDEMHFRVLTDAASGAVNWLVVHRTGTDVDSIIFPLVDVFDIQGNLTVDSIGNITQANLLDKTDTEDITGAWTFKADGAKHRLLGDITVATPPTTEAITNKLHFYDSDNTDEIGYIGYEAGSSYVLWNKMRAGTMQMLGLSSAGANKQLAVLDPAGESKFYYAGAQRLSTDNDGITVIGDVGATKIGGITEANLLDKTAIEIITAGWEFTGLGLGSEAILINNVLPRLAFEEDGVTADNQVWYLDCNSEQFGLKVVNDARSVTSSCFVWNRTGTTVDNFTLTGAGTISGTLIATSFGGITEANLLDKTAIEVVSAIWAFNTGMGIRGVGTSDADIRLIAFQHSSGVQRGIVGYDAASAVLFLRNQIHGADLQLTCENAAGTAIVALTADPDANSVNFPGSVLISSGGDDVTFSHDGTDFNTVCVNTADWKITGQEYVIMNKLTNSFSTVGQTFHSSGNCGFVRSGGVPLDINRLSNDGNLMGLYAQTVLEGAISVSGTTVTYGGGHFAFLSQLPISSVNRRDNTITRGTVMEYVNEKAEWYYEDWIEVVDKEEMPRRLVVDGPNGGTGKGTVTKKENEQRMRSKPSTTAGTKKVAGVFDRWDDDNAYDNSPEDGNTWDYDFHVATTGDFVIRVTGPCDIGDLLESNGDGTARVQADDIVRSSTIAKATQRFLGVAPNAENPELVPCQLLNG